MDEQLLARLASTGETSEEWAARVIDRARRSSITAAEALEGATVFVALMAGSDQEGTSG